MKGSIKKLSPDRFFVFSILIFSLTILTSPTIAQAAEDSARIYFLHAMKAKEEGDNLTAESFLRKALEIEPDNPDFHFELGNLYIEQNNLEPARMELEQTVMILPAHLAAHYNLGLVYRDLRLMGDARNEFRKVLQLDPANIKAKLQIGYTYQEEGFFDDARQAFEEARDMDVTNPEPDEALQDLTEAEAKMRQRSSREMEQTFQRNQGFLYSQDSSARNSQPSSKDSLIQAGSALIQQLMARRSKND